MANNEIEIRIRTLIPLQPVLVRCQRCIPNDKKKLLIQVSHFMQEVCMVGSGFSPQIKKDRAGPNPAERKYSFMKLNFGQAAIRKKNGTYFGQPNYKPPKQSNHKPSVQPAWRPTADDLQLMDVPKEHRQSVRQFLKPILDRMTYGIKGGDCWAVAQALMKAANDPRVSYVEGVWTRAKNSGFYSGDKEPAPHGWNLVDGYPVDLVAEFYFWNSGGDDHPWLHEPLKIYSLDEVRKYEEEIGDLDTFSITVTICAYGYAEEFGLKWTEADQEEAEKPEVSYEEVAMRDAAERLNSSQGSKTYEEVAA
jgi:hypothetical protein